MSHVAIRYNKTRGQPGRGTEEHRWRVFTDGQEYLFKNVQINVPSYSEKDPYSDDWNIACDGRLEIVKDTSTAVIHPDSPKD